MQYCHALPTARKSPLLGLILSTALFSESSLGQEAPAVSNLEAIVVTGTRTEKLLSDSPVKVEIVSQQEIRLKNARDVKEAIKDVPGILLKKIHGKSGYEAWMQGIDAKRVLVLVDGEPVAKSTTGVTDLTQLGTTNIQQIEIVKGATSALYGSGAIGGVINIITRKPETPIAYSLKADLGSHGDQNIDGSQTSISTRSSSGSFYAQNEQWDGNASYDLRETDGFTVDTQANSWSREGAAGHKINTQAELGYSHSASQRVFASASYYHEDLDTRFVGAGPTFLKSSKAELVERQIYRAGGDWLLSDMGEIDLRYHYQHFRNNTEQDVVTNPGLEQWRKAQHVEQKLASKWSYDPQENVTRTLGAEVYTAKISQAQWKTRIGASKELKPGADRTNKVLYAQDDIFVGERLELLPGFRFQHDSDFGRYFAPKVNGRVELDAISGSEHFIRFGAGRGYRVPNLKERFFVFDHSQHGYMVHGNEDLTPEFSDSLQLGWNIQQEGLFSVDINLFRNKLKDLIETEFSHMLIDPDFGPVQIFRYTNLNKAKTKGVEIASMLKIHDDWKFNSGYTYLDARNLDNGKPLPKRPRHQVKAGLDYTPQTSNLAFNISARWQSKEYFDLENYWDSPGYSVLDFSTNYRFSEHLSVYGGVDNIRGTQKNFDNEHDLRPEEGRYVYLGLRLEQI